MSNRHPPQKPTPSPYMPHENISDGEDVDIGGMDSSMEMEAVGMGYVNGNGYSNGGSTSHVNGYAHDPYHPSSHTSHQLASTSQPHPHSNSTSNASTPNGHSHTPSTNNISVLLSPPPPPLSFTAIPMPILPPVPGLLSPSSSTTSTSGGTNNIDASVLLHPPTTSRARRRPMPGVTTNDNARIHGGTSTSALEGHINIPTNNNANATTTKRNKGWLSRRFVYSGSGSADDEDNGSGWWDGVISSDGGGGSGGDSASGGGRFSGGLSWRRGGKGSSGSGGQGSLLPSPAGSRPPSRSKRRKDKDRDRERDHRYRDRSPYMAGGLKGKNGAASPHLAMGMDRLLHPRDRRPVHLRSLPSMVLNQPRYIVWLMWILITRHPETLLYIFYLISIFFYPIVCQIPRKSYGFLVRPFPEPTDVDAWLQKFVLPRGGFVSSWIEKNHRRDWNRHFMWHFPIEELVTGRGTEEFEVPRLGKPIRRKRRSLGEFRADGWEEEIEPRSVWDVETENLDPNTIIKPSRTLKIQQGWKRDLAAGIPLDDARHRSRFFHEIYANTSLHHYKDDLDLISPAFLAMHTFSIAGSDSARAERDLVRRYQRTRIPKEYYHLIDFQFVICSPFGLHEYGWALDPRSKSAQVSGGRGRAYKNRSPAEQRRIWEELKAEQEEFGDILIVDEMEMFSDQGKGAQGTMKENMDYGKTYGWLREVAKRAQDGRGRKSMFVMKTDGDAYHILPNLLNFLLDYDFTKPVYFGSSLGTHYAANAYMQGLGYGFSWPLLQTLVAANLPPHVICGLEDHITGSWMYSLPASRPIQEYERQLRLANASHVNPDTDLQLQTHWPPEAPPGEHNCIREVPETCVRPLIMRRNSDKMPDWVTRYRRVPTKPSPGTPSINDALTTTYTGPEIYRPTLTLNLPKRILPDTLWAYDPPSPDPYTGLIRADMYERASSWWYWWVPKTEKLITAHGMKTRKEFLDAWEKLEGLWLNPNWIGQSAHSVPYWWKPPAWMHPAAEET